MISNKKRKVSFRNYVVRYEDCYEWIMEIHYSATEFERIVMRRTEIKKKSTDAEKIKEERGEELMDLKRKTIV